VSGAGRQVFAGSGLSGRIRSVDRPRAGEDGWSTVRSSVASRSVRVRASGFCAAERLFRPPQSASPRRRNSNDRSPVEVRRPQGQRRLPFTRGAGSARGRVFSRPRPRAGREPHRESFLARSKGQAPLRLPLQDGVPFFSPLGANFSTSTQKVSQSFRLGRSKFLGRAISFPARR